MKKNSISTRLQSIFAITRYELSFAAILVSGLLIFSIVKYFGLEGNDRPGHEDMTDMIYKALDSLAEVSRSTYTGVGENGEAVPSLAAGDTVVEKETFFPQARKKQMPSNLIDLNKASKTELMKLPGVGEKTAEMIVAYRKEHNFTRPSDIMDIKGIGKKKFEKMKPFIEVK